MQRIGRWAMEEGMGKDEERVQVQRVQSLGCSKAKGTKVQADGILPSLGGSGRYLLW